MPRAITFIEAAHDIAKLHPPRDQEAHTRVVALGEGGVRTATAVFQESILEHAPLVAVGAADEVVELLRDVGEEDVREVLVARDVDDDREVLVDALVLVEEARELVEEARVLVEL
ncbi:hypothetical protein TRAPUB_6204 [Trametes pubescens]|uniref:Uncharacterized protein n=1 Tax=Trametes pubescens TaxID=154538 RepID=A0A1M2V6N5_TRAPU|nr:hypothetical protein TRAPUB_6204 [Trametes pubescens]